MWFNSNILRTVIILIRMQCCNIISFEGINKVCEEIEASLSQKMLTAIEFKLVEKSEKKAFPQMNHTN